jgi:predicted DsbA family dithiol-disulfide isomerase
VRVDVWSDLVCPWCYLGKRRFERVLTQLDWGDEVEVRWRAYQLDPAAPEEPGDLRATLDAKYGPGAFDQMTPQLTDLGRREGIDYRFDRALRVNTRRAHELAAAAWEQGGAEAQGRVVDRLFRAYFTEGANIAEPAELRRLWGESGLDGDPTGAEAAVDADLEQAATYQLRGVPAFVIDERHLISGAQEVETFRQALERLRREPAA